jgi:hypothetical protein
MAQKLSEISKVAVDNTAAAALLRGWYARYGQGAGVLTESDLNVFYNNLGSISERYGVKVAELLTGTPTEDKVKMINEALEATAKVASGRRMALGEKIVDKMLSQREVYRNDDEWKLHTATYVRNYAPAYMPEFEKQFGTVNQRAFMSSPGASPGAPPSTGQQSGDQAARRKVLLEKLAKLKAAKPSGGQ